MNKPPFFWTDYGTPELLNYPRDELRPTEDLALVLAGQDDPPSTIYYYPDDFFFGCPKHKEN